MRHLVIALIIFLNIGITNGQRIVPEIDQFEYIDSPGLNYYFQISNKPVTNFDYLTYLCWINDVYSDYPDIIINAFPYLEIDSLSPKQKHEIEDYYTRFQKLIEISNSEYVNRLFDYNYINYPVIGLSKMQIYKFSKWLTDRYNENYAIDKNVFQWDPNQIGSENFSTESYLNGQYEGLVNKNIRDKTTKQYRRINWSDNYFISTFRLPTDKEISIVGLEIEMKEYNGFTFIKKWSDFYIIYNKNGLTLKRKDMSRALLTNYKIANKIVLDNKTKIAEYSIRTDSVREQGKLQAIYQILGQTITHENTNFTATKDSLGYYPFQIIGTKDSEPIYANPPVKNDDKNIAIFRLVLNGLK
jgi:hypothetical protein